MKMRLLVLILVVLIAVSGCGRISSSESSVSDSKSETASEASSKDDTASESPVSEGFDLDGKGTEEAPYLISDKAGLLSFASELNGGKDTSGLFFALTADIQLNPADIFETDGVPDTEWTPAGTKNNPFRGSFDGANFHIIGLYCVDEAMNSCAALFGYASGAEIKNVALSDGALVCNNGDAAGIAAFADGCIIERCTAYITISGKEAGGICASFGSGRIFACINRGSVNGTDAGGIVGSLAPDKDTSAVIVGCVNDGKINGSSSGGIVGNGISGHGSAVPRHCMNRGEISGASGDTFAAAGGIVGSAWCEGSAITVFRCFNSGKIVSPTAGGIAGFMKSVMSGGTGSDSMGECVLMQCFSVGEISGTLSGGIMPKATNEGGYGAEAYVYDCFCLGSETDFGQSITASQAAKPEGFGLEYGGSSWELDKEAGYPTLVNYFASISDFTLS